MQQAVQQVRLCRVGRLAQLGGVRGAGHGPLRTALMPRAAGVSGDDGRQAEAHEEEGHKGDEEAASLDHLAGGSVVG